MARPIVRRSAASPGAALAASAVVPSTWVCLRQGHRAKDTGEALRGVPPAGAALRKTLFPRGSRIEMTDKMPPDKSRGGLQVSLEPAHVALRERLLAIRCFLPDSLPADYVPGRALRDTELPRGSGGTETSLDLSTGGVYRAEEER